MWARLRAQRPVSDEALEAEPVGGDVPGGMFAVDHRGDLHLLMPVAGPHSGHAPPDLKGLKVRHRVLQDIGDCVDLVAGAAHEGVFTPLCREILDRVEDGAGAWDAVSSTVRAWQATWRPCGSQLEKTVQIGLYGELLTLERLLIPALGPAAVHHWSGPEYERHDFVGERLHLEVKTTTRSRHEHEISRVDQLDVPHGRRLLLVSLLLERSLAGQDTLADRIDAVSSLVRSDAEAWDAFHSKLVAVGWSDEMRRTGELLRFSGVRPLVVPVEGNFPRLPVGLILPAGIVSLRYTVDLVNLPSLGLDEVIEQVRSDFPPGR